MMNEKPLVNGMKITKSVKIRAGVYQLTAKDGGAPVIQIEGNDITVDFNNCTLNGARPGITPDYFTGVALTIYGGRNIVIKNLKVKGYNIAIRSKNVKYLTLDNCDLSYNYKVRSYGSDSREINQSLIYKDENELPHGGAIDLKHCHSAIIRNCKTIGGQNVLMMSDCNDGEIYNNIFCFNSGTGIGMYHCSNNKVMFNNISFNVMANQGEEQTNDPNNAAILLDGQSRNNIVYKNLLTHNTNGFILFTDDDDNVIMSNDFSYSIDDGVRLSAHRTVLSDNRFFDCSVGVWGRGTNGSNISSNKFRGNNIDIALVNGENNKITYNVFYDSKEAIRLWTHSRAIDTGRVFYSRDYAIAYNNFNKTELALLLKNTSDINVFENIEGRVDKFYEMDSTVTGLDTAIHADMQRLISIDTAIAVPTVDDPADPMKGAGKLAGRKNNIMTEWGPYNFNYPIIVNDTAINADLPNIQFSLLGPPGKWKIVDSKNLDFFSAKTGDVPGKLIARKTATAPNTIYEVTLQYTGKEFINPFGEVNKANKPWIFTFRRELSAKEPFRPNDPDEHPFF
jgi:parallel beta-helix repeat protein